MGSGRVIQMAGEVKAKSADLVIFNDDLTPSQIRNLEKVLLVRTVDRSMLILDIFSRHARTRESKLQVELAQMGYLSPRLTRLWSHLGQQAGMSGSRGRIATRGPGEKQLELDRRLVKKRIADLKEELSRVDEERRTQKKMREGVFKTCLAGYTNVGKSSLLNAMSGATVLVEDKLFATLDATTRRVFIPDHGEILLSDTVGFIRKLPHHLVASFKSTLEVITDANLILPVMDASSDQLDEHMETVNRVLNELETIHIPKLLVFNKIDLIDGAVLERLKATHPEAVFVSAVKREGLEALKKAILSFIKGLRTSASAKEAAA
jgi:GTP-binding protein HflX